MFNQCNNDCKITYLRNIFRGKGDYHRLGHGTDDHVRRPRKVSALHNKKVISIAVGSLHCVVCTDGGKLNSFLWLFIELSQRKYS